jgi:glycosyltransferase involved in cell wall biosynthesis
MPVYRTERFLNRAIQSIFDQDLDEWELIICLDGPSSRADKIIRPFLKDPRVQCITIEHGGACKARNEAAKLSKGKYLSFFSSDFIMFPGALSLWLEKFEENPKYDFLFGPYALIDGEMLFQPEHTKTDFFLLSTRNYIDGGFPLKRELWEKHPWDEDIYSLNDWDFWLSIVKAGHEGLYVQEITYSAEMPRAGGLSKHSQDNWLTQTALIKKKHGIPVNDICVASFGAKYHAIGMAKLLGADFTQTPNFKPNRYKMIYLMGYYLNAADVHARVIMNHIYTEHAKKVIHHIGGDTWQFGELMGIRKVKKHTKLFKDLGIIHLCETEDAQKELANYNINAQIIPVPSLVEDKYEVLPMPKKFKVAVYLPSKEKDPYEKYMQGLMAHVIKDMRDVKFKLFGTDRKGKDGNTEYDGWVDMVDLAKECSVMLRIVQHDSTPISCLDFIQFGREAITNIPGFPYMHHINTGDMFMVDKCDNMMLEANEIVNTIKKTIYDLKKGKGYLNSEKAREYYKLRFGQDQYVKKIKRLLALEDIAGCLNDLSPEQRKQFDEATTRRCLLKA